MSGRMKFWLAVTILLALDGLMAALQSGGPASTKAPVNNYNQVIQLIRSRYRDKSVVAELQPARQAITASQRDERLKTLVAGLPERWNHYEAPQVEGKETAHLNHPGFLLKKEGDELVIDMVALGTPGHFAGLRRGDKITRVDEKELAGESIDQVMQMLMRPPEAFARLGCLSADGQLGTALLRYNLGTPPVIAGILPGGAWYLAMTNLDSDAVMNGFPKELRRLFRESRRNVPGIVLDLRNNPGGRLGIAQKLAGCFMRTGTIGSLKLANGKLVPQPVEAYLGWTEGDSAEETRALCLRLYRAPLVVLINESTASAAEALAVGLKESGRATLIGATSYGKAEVVESFDLDYGGKLDLVTGTNLSPQGQNYERLGIEPQIAVKQARGTGGDEQLLAAIHQLSQIPEIDDGNDSVPMPMSWAFYLAYAAVLLSVLGGLVTFWIHYRRRRISSARA